MTNRAFPLNGSRSRATPDDAEVFDIRSRISSYLFFSLRLSDREAQPGDSAEIRVCTRNPTNHVKCVPPRAIRWCLRVSMRALNLFFACNYFQTTSRVCTVKRLYVSLSLSPPLSFYLFFSVACYWKINYDLLKYPYWCNLLCDSCITLFGNEYPIT